MTVAKLVAHQQEYPEGTSAPFSEVRPLPPPMPEAPELPIQLITESLRGWIADISERLQVPPELVAAPALVALASVVGRKLGIHPKAHDDWLVVPNLWGGIVARPGKMKSPTLAEALKPLRRLVSEAQHHHQETMDAAGAHLDSLKAKESAIKEQLKRAHKSSDGQAGDPSRVL